jgi:3-oxoadipate enol-lactonase
MPVIDADGCPIHVEIDGREDAPVLMLSNSLGTTLDMWAGQVEAFTQTFRLVRYDRRGHGRSGQPPGPYTMERLARDALAVMDGLRIAKACWCGLSMGGMEGMWLGANAGARFERMVLANTSSWYADKAFWNERIDAIRKTGSLAPLADRIMRLWFTRAFLERDPAAVEPLRAALAATPIDGYIACSEAVRDMDHRALLPMIAAPTLVIVGAHDQATRPAAGEYVQQQIPGAERVTLDTAHISNVEAREAFNTTVMNFLTRA